jgi:hypothetical protein
LLDVSRPDVGEWTPEDQRSILEHQLAAPLFADADRYAQIAGCSAVDVERIISASGCHSFGDVLSAEPPSVSALRLLKEYAKAVLGGAGDLPRDVGRVLYVLAILHGRRAGARDISSLNAATIERETRHCLTFGWLPDPVREQLRRG